MITFDTVLESLDFIIYNKKILGTIGVPIWIPFGTQSMPMNVENVKKIDFCFLKIRYNGTQNGTQVVPKLPDTFFQMKIFHHFSSPKNGYMTTLARILGTIDIFLGKHTMSAI